MVLVRGLFEPAGEGGEGGCDGWRSETSWSRSKFLLLIKTDRQKAAPPPEP